MAECAPRHRAKPGATGQVLDEISPRLTRRTWLVPGRGPPVPPGAQATRQSTVRTIGARRVPPARPALQPRGSASHRTRTSAPPPSRHTGTHRDRAEPVPSRSDTHSLSPPSVGILLRPTQAFISQLGIFPSSGPKTNWRGDKGRKGKERKYRQRIRNVKMSQCSYLLTSPSMGLPMPWGHLVPLLIHWGEVTFVLWVVPTHLCVRSPPPSILTSPTHDVNRRCAPPDSAPASKHRLACGPLKKHAQAPVQPAGGGGLA